VLAQTEPINGRICAYNFSSGLSYLSYKVDKKQFATNKLEVIKTYEIDLNSTFEINTTTNEFATLIFANNTTVKIEQNSEFRVDGFNMALSNIKKYPSKINVDSYNMNLSLMEGEAYFIISKNNTNNQFILQTSVSNLGLNTGKYYIQSTKKSVLVYILDGTLDVYDNITNKRETIKSGNAVLIHSVALLSPKQIELFGDRMTTSVKKVKSEQFKPTLDVISKIELVKDDVIFISIATNIVAVKIK